MNGSAQWLTAICALAISPLFACSSAAEPADSTESATGGDSAESDNSDGPVATLTGNGAPSGAHFNLNIIGVSNPKSVGNSGGGVIFVPLVGTTKIALSEGDFAVLDSNGTDGSASFQLPNPDPTNSGTTTYSVFARALGKPGGSSTTTTCAADPTTGEVLCSVFPTVLVRSKGGSKFADVSKSLLFVTVDIDGDGTLDRVPLFDSRLQDFFFSVSNNGLKLAQLRFYPVPSTVQ